MKELFTDTTSVNPIKSKKNGTIILASYENDAAWQLAFNVVNYPVEVVPLYWGDNNLAKGMTNSNRNVQHFGILVDRNRDNNKQVIATVTDSYHTINTESVYRDLHKDLLQSVVIGKPERVYVSTNGGRQTLTVRLEKLTTPVLSIGSFSMAINLTTSVDGTLKHSISVNPIDESGRTVFGIESEFSFSSKHTKNIKERHVAFSLIIESMLREWNEVIAPMMSLMDSTKLDANVALDLVKNILEASGIPDKHTNKMIDDVSEGSNHTALSVLHGITSYIDDALSDNRPERVEQFKKTLNKTAMKVIKNKLKIS
jgi:hypothetical protein